MFPPLLRAWWAFEDVIWVRLHQRGRIALGGHGAFHELVTVSFAFCPGEFFFVAKIGKPLIQFSALSPCLEKLKILFKFICLDYSLGSFAVWGGFFPVQLVAL